jgi:hypothetical protein
MSQRERTGWRSEAYSRWHRTASISRYLPLRLAARLKMCDIDAVEACAYCSTPLALIEIQESTAPPKRATITARLASMAGIPAFSVSYVVDGDDIAWFRQQRIAPTIGAVADYPPDTYATWLASLREGHRCNGTEEAA